MNNGISRDDLNELIGHVREIVRLHVKYIKLGFKLTEVAATFGQVYFKELKKQLDGEAVEIVNCDLISKRKNGDLRKVDRKEIAVHLCLEMSSTLIEVISLIALKIGGGKRDA